MGCDTQVCATDFLIVAHRGDINQIDGYPENTLEALLQAAKRGADGVEFDVQQTSDGEWALLHDTAASALNRTTNLTGTVDSKALATIQAGQIDGGFGYDAERHGSSLIVPSATQVMTALERYDLIIYWHLKDKAESAGTNLANFIIAGGWRQRSIILCDGGTSQAAAVKAVDATIETSTLVMTDNPPQPSADVDRLLAEVAFVTNTAYVKARQPDPVDCFPLMEDWWGTDECTILASMWVYGVSLYLTADLPRALAYRNEIVESLMI
jgi:Glycerophosphoryl diester phosphodiesterase family